MLAKQTLKVEGTYNDKMVGIKSAVCSYIDEDFYKEHMEEDLNEVDYKSYPVKVMALRMNWIVKDMAGREFLLGILRSENLSLYTIPTIEILIEYLYLQYKNLILKYRLPVYLC